MANSPTRWGFCGSTLGRHCALKAIPSGGVTRERRKHALPTVHPARKRECQAPSPTSRLKTGHAQEEAERKPNYEFERRERARLKAIKNAEKAAAKKEARERAKSQAAGAEAPGDVDSKEEA